MQITQIDNLATFKQIKKNWDDVYEADPQAHFFLSWVWLSGWLPIVHELWFILAAKPDVNSSYVAFFPLKIMVQYESGSFKTTISMVGNSMADYTGLVCLPNYETEVIPAFAAYMQKELAWCSFNLKSILQTDSRIPLLLQSFSDDGFKFNQLRVHSVDPKDPSNYVAPYISLPNTWQDYLQNYVSSNTRQKIRRFSRKVSSSDEFRITHVNADNLKSQIDILLDLWGARWCKKMGKNYDTVINYYRLILHHCFYNNCLYLPILWQGDRPLGAIANFIDLPQKSMLFIMTGRDRQVKNPPPGLVLHAHAIRYAIEQGFKIYDFLMGDEEYKYSFGVKERHIEHLVIENQNYDRQQPDIEQILPLAFKLTVRNHRANRLDKAEQGYRQILEIDPDYGEALYGLAVLMRQKSEYQAAKQLLAKMLEIQPNAAKAWFSLGNLYQIQGQLSEAVAAYTKMLMLEPKAIAAYNNLGYVLQLQGKWSEAIACYQKALELKPDCIEAEVNQANALYALGKLDSEQQKYYAELNSNLGTQCKQLGDFQTAIAYYQQSLNLNPGLAKAQENLKLLQEPAVSTCS